MLELVTNKYYTRCLNCGATTEKSFKGIKIAPKGSNSIVVGPFCESCLKDLAIKIVQEQ